MEVLNVEAIQEIDQKTLSKSMNKIIPAGGISIRAVEMNQQDKEAQMRIRTYKAEDDWNREIEYRDALTRIDQGYKRVYNENSWNEQKRLAPKYQVYHHLNHRFRKSPRDLEQVKSQEREDKFQLDKTFALTSKQESRERYAARQLERTLLQSKADQPLSEQSQLEALSLQQTDPNLVLDLLQKKKWRNVQKDPIRIMNNQSIDTTSYWLYLNNLPRKSVGNIVTDYVVKVDKEGCERILGKILDQKHTEDEKRIKQQNDRALLMHKLKLRHNKQMMLEKQSGVRLGSLRPKKTNDDQVSPSKFVETFSDANIEPITEGQSKLELSKELSSIEIKTPSFKESVPQKMSTLRVTIPNHLQIVDQEFQFKFSPNKKPKCDNPRETILSLPKTEYQGKDFFWRSEFRGLILADYQEAIGKKAFKCVEAINKSTVSQFSQLKSFQDCIDQKKKIQKFYSQSRQESQRARRPHLDQSNFTNYQQSVLSMRSPLNSTLTSSLLVQQKIQEINSKVRAVTTTGNINGEKRNQSLESQIANRTITDTESAFRPKTTINSAFYQNDLDEQADRIFKKDPPRLETVDERMSYLQRPSKTAHAQRLTTATTIVEQELSNLNSELKNFESRLGFEGGKPTKGANRYPNVQLQKVFHPKTSQSTRNKVSTLQSTLIV